MCEVEGCGKAFTKASNLRAHVRGVHQGVRPFQCTVEGCGKTFTRSDVLKKHIRSVHEGARPFKCTVERCGKTFTERDHLKTHVRFVHDGARPFKCTVKGCGRAFQLGGGLKKHVRGVHEGARPFKSTVEGCGKAFQLSGGLTRHVRTVHGGQVSPLTGIVKTDSAKRQIADPPVAVKIEDSQDQVVNTISAPAPDFSLSQQIKYEHGAPRDDARLQFFQRLDSQARLGACVTCEFLHDDDGTMQHYRGIVTGSNPASPSTVNILFDDGEQWRDWPVDDILLIESLSPEQEALFLADFDVRLFRGSRKRRASSAGNVQRGEDSATLPPPWKRSKLEDSE